MTLIFRIWEALLNGFVVAILLMLACYPVCVLEISLSSKTDKKLRVPSSVAVVCFCLIVIPKRIDILPLKGRKTSKKKDHS